MDTSSEDDSEQFDALSEDFEEKVSLQDEDVERPDGKKLKDLIKESIELIDGKFLCKICEKKYSSKATLLRHLRLAHELNSKKYFKCGEGKCNGRKFLTASEFEKHLWLIHTIGKGKLLKCEEEGCKTECKTNTDLNRHLWQVHDKGEGELFKCEEEGCKYECKFDYKLKDHAWRIHKKGEGKIYKCTEEGCDFESSYKRGIDRHLWRDHGKEKPQTTDGKEKPQTTDGKKPQTPEEEIQWFKCGEKNCSVKCKEKCLLKKHLWEIHVIGEGKWYNCDKENCNYRTRNSNTFKVHMSFTHDIGDKECDICCRNVFKLKPYHDPKTEEDLNVCGNCMKKLTGYESSREKLMVEFLQKDEDIGPYIVLKNSIIKGKSCNTLRRPDMLISSSEDLYLIIECDEYQHRGRNYNRSCEEGRLNEILDELPGGRVVIIRWNPDTYKVNGEKGKVERPERLEKLREVIIKLIDREYTEDDNIEVIYMYYDVDNELITDKFKTELILY